jgi:hypothetical protein
MQPGAPDMTPRKGQTPEDFRARQRERYAAAILNIGKCYWHGSGNGGGDATRPILCTGNSSWNSSANATLLIPSIGKRSWNRSGDATPGR